MFKTNWNLFLFFISVSSVFAILCFYNCSYANEEYDYELFERKLEEASQNCLTSNLSDEEKLDCARMFLGMSMVISGEIGSLMIRVSKRSLSSGELDALEEEESRLEHQFQQLQDIRNQFYLQIGL